MLKVLLLILGLLLAFFLETLFSVFGGFSILVIIFLFSFSKFNWKYILFLGIPISLFLDVVNHSVLGTQLLVFGGTILFFYLISLFIPEQDSLFGLIPFLISFIVFYLLSYFLKEILLLGTFPFFEWSTFALILIESVVSCLVVLLLSILYDRVRGNKVGAKFTFR